MDLRELYNESQAAVLQEIYDADKRSSPGTNPCVPICFIDATASVGNGSKVWHFARVLAGVVIGRDCSIGGGTEIGRGSWIGNRSRIGANCFLPPNSRIGEQVFIAPNVTFCDDKFPRVPNAKDPPYNAQPPAVGNYASIGAGCTILPGVTIGEYARIAAGSLVTKNVPAHEMWIGSPAKPRELIPAGWTDAEFEQQPEAWHSP